MLCWVMLHQLMLQDSLDLDFGWVLCGSLTGARAHLQCGLSCSGSGHLGLLDAVIVGAPCLG